MTPPATRAAFLLLVDARLPTGGHAHSGGMEEAVAAGRVKVLADLGPWLLGRLATVGAVEAALAGAATVVAARPEPGGSWLDLDAEWAARTASPALRDASRAQGRGLLRAARRCWPHPALDRLAADLKAGAPWPLVLGAAGAAAGCGPGEATLAAAWAAVTGPAWATTRLLGTDPHGVAAVLAGLAPAVERAAADGLDAAAGAASDAGCLPSSSAPLLDLGAEHHATWEVRLFAS